MTIDNQPEEIKPGAGIGIKYDAGKLPLDLLPPEAILALGEVQKYGAEKYGVGTWDNVEKDRYEAALLRHLMAYKMGEQYDRESGLHHLKHVLCNAAYMVAIHERGIKTGN